MKKDSHFANFYISKLFVYSLLYPEEDNLLYYSLGGIARKPRPALLN
jgi:hypothetical protein